MVWSARADGSDAEIDDQVAPCKGAGSGAGGGNIAVGYACDTVGAYAQ